MRKILIIIAAILISQTSLAQLNADASQKLMVRNIEINQLNEFLRLTEDEMAGVVGSPYSNEEFLLGNIYQNDKLISKDVLMRYNSFSDEIEMKTDATSTEYGALLKSPDIFVKIINDVYIFVPQNNSVEDGAYFKVIAPGVHFDLYKNTSTTYSPPQKGETTYDQDKPGRFISNEKFYLVSKNGNFTELPSNKNKVLKVMSVKKDELKKYINSQRLNVKREDDLIKLVNYFNSLL